MRHCIILHKINLTATNPYAKFLVMDYFKMALVDILQLQTVILPNHLNLNNVYAFYMF